MMGKVKMAGFLWLDILKKKGTAKGTDDHPNCRSVPRSFEKELVPVQFLTKGTSSRNLRSSGQFLEMTEFRSKSLGLFNQEPI